MAELWQTGSSDLSSLANSKTTKSEVIDGLRAKNLISDDMHTLTKHQLVAHAIYDCVRQPGTPDADDGQLKRLTEMNKKTNDDLKQLLRENGVSHQGKNAKAELWRLYALHELARGYVNSSSDIPNTKTLAEEGITSPTLLSPISERASVNNLISVATNSNTNRQPYWELLEPSLRTSISPPPRPISLQRRIADMGSPIEPLRSRGLSNEPSLQRESRASPIPGMTTLSGLGFNNEPSRRSPSQPEIKSPRSVDKADSKYPSRSSGTSIDASVLRGHITTLCNKVSSAQDPAQYVTKWLDSYLPTQLLNLARPDYDDVFIRHIESTMQYRAENERLERMKEVLQREMRGHCKDMAELSMLMHKKSQQIEDLEVRLSGLSQEWEDGSLDKLHRQIRNDLSEEAKEKVNKLLRPRSTHPLHSMG